MVGAKHQWHMEALWGTYMLQFFDVQQQLLIVGLVGLDDLRQAGILILQSSHLPAQALNLQPPLSTRDWTSPVLPPMHFDTNTLMSARQRSARVLGHCLSDRHTYTRTHTAGYVHTKGYSPSYTPVLQAYAEVTMHISA